MKKETIDELEIVKNLMTNDEIKTLSSDQYTPTINAFLERTLKHHFKKIAFFTIVSVLISYYLKYRINAFMPNILDLIYHKHYYFSTIAVLAKLSMIIALWYLCILFGYNHHKLENIISSNEDKKQYIQLVYNCSSSLNDFHLMLSTMIFMKYSGILFLSKDNLHYHNMWILSIFMLTFSVIPFILLRKNPKKQLSFNKLHIHLKIINILLLFLML